MPFFVRVLCKIGSELLWDCQDAADQDECDDRDLDAKRPSPAERITQVASKYCTAGGAKAKEDIDIRLIDAPALYLD